MGACAAQKQKQPNKEGQLEQVVAEVRQSRDCDSILKKRASQSSNLNPFKNPILERRLKEMPSSPQQMTNPG